MVEQVGGMDGFKEKLGVAKEVVLEQAEKLAGVAHEKLGDLRHGNEEGTVYKDIQDDDINKENLGATTDTKVKKGKASEQAKDAKAKKVEL